MELLLPFFLELVEKVVEKLPQLPEIVVVSEYGMQQEELGPVLLGQSLGIAFRRLGVRREIRREKNLVDLHGALTIAPTIHTIQAVHV